MANGAQSELIIAKLHSPTVCCLLVVQKLFRPSSQNISTNLDCPSTTASDRIAGSESSHLGVFDVEEEVMPRPTSK